MFKMMVLAAMSLGILYGIGMWMGSNPYCDAPHRVVITSGRDEGKVFYLNGPPRGHHHYKYRYVSGLPGQWPEGYYWFNYGFGDEESTWVVPKSIAKVEWD